MDTGNVSSEKARQFMQTPCQHKYHIYCLRNWMNIKLECPSCRHELPPIEEDED